MMKTKIVIAGVGGVGGYYGGLLAKHYYKSENVEVIFWVRGRHLAEIRKNGLRVITPEGDFVARPFLATDNIAEIGVADLIIVATKSYDLELVMEQLKPCLGAGTTILPLLNGVDSRERIKAILPDHLVLDGCVYIVSRLKQPGVVEKTGKMQALYFGLNHFANERIIRLGHLLKDAGIEATLSLDIEELLWEKFIFISPTATATSYFNKCIGELLTDEACLQTVNELLHEVKQLAEAKGILVAANATEKVMNKLKALPFEATSSMHSDYKAAKATTELESLIGYVINQAKEHALATPAYLAAYEALSRRTIQTRNS